MGVAEDAGKSPGSRAIAVIARDRKAKSHRGGAEERSHNQISRRFSQIVADQNR
jgi:hypothetical protein